MEIKTRFNVGDTVYFISNNTLVKGEIRWMHIHVNEDGQRNEYYIHNWVREENVFASPEEATNYLIKNMEE